jgi:hypothetical protein
MKRLTPPHRSISGRLAILLLGLLLGLSSCAGRTETPEASGAAGSPPAEDESSVEPQPGRDDEQASAPRPSPDLGVSAQQVDGVWVFTNANEDEADALTRGPVSISDGCLFVGTEIVVWHERRLDEVRQYIDAVRRGSPPDLTLGGGEGRLVPVIHSHCGAQTVWFTN